MARKPSPEFLLTAALLALIGYLSLWPVPILPIAWDAPQDRGLLAPFAPNDALADMHTFRLGGFGGPEDIAGGPDQLIYASTESGSIVRFGQDGRGLQEFASVGGRPLGIEFDPQGNLLVANAMLGLQRVDPEGGVETLFDNFGGVALIYANDLAIANNGKIYLTESSTKFGAGANGGTYKASLLDILEHGGHGRLYEFDPNSNTAKLLLIGFNFANGVAISADQQYLLIAETGHYRIWRYWLDGEKAGTAEVVIENLPGFPDNINRGFDGRFWVGLIAPRNALLDRLADKPLLRSVVQRLPAAIRPSAGRSTHLIGIDGDGQVLMNLQDSAAGFPSVTGAFEHVDNLYLSSLFGDRVAYLPRSKLPIE